jgi:hypothetical protein
MMDIWITPVLALTETSFGFLVVIAALCFGGILCLIRNYGRYALQRRYIHVVREFLEMAPPSTQDEVPEIEGVPPESIVGRRVAEIHRMRQTPARVNVGDLTNAAESEEDSRWPTTIPNVLISVLLILGLGGTLWSLQNMLGKTPELSEQITREGGLNPETTGAFVKEVYQGFGDAFTASLSGIGGTILLLVGRTGVVNRIRDRFFSELDRLTTEVLIPRFLPRELSQGEALLEAAAKLDHVVSGLGGLSKGLEQSHATAAASAETLLRFASRIESASTALAGAVGPEAPLKVSIDGLQMIVGRIEASIQSDLQQRSNQQDKWQQAFTSFGEQAKAMSGLTSRMEGAMNLIAQSMAERRKEAAEQQAAAQQAARSVHANLEAFSAQQAKAWEALRADAGSAFASAGRQITDALAAWHGRSDEQAVAFLQLLEKLAGQHREIAGSITQALDGFLAQQQNAWDGMLDGANAAFQDVRKQTASALEEWQRFPDGQAEVFAAHVETIATQHAQVVRAQQEAVSHLHKSFDTSLKGCEERLDQVAKSVAPLSKLSGTVTELSANMKKLTGVVEKNSVDQAAIVEKLGEIAGRLAELPQTRRPWWPTFRKR